MPGHGVWHGVWAEKRCAACSAPFVPYGSSGHATSQYFCPACLEKLIVLCTGYCPLCGEIAAWPLLPPAPCGRCVQSPPPWSSFTFFAPYEGLLRRLVLSFKFQEKLVLANPLAGLVLARQGPAPVGYTRLVPVPLHAHRLQQRGYNQAYELCKALYSQWPERARPLLLPEALERTRATTPQAQLPRAARKENIQGVFHVPETKHVAGHKVVLVDDISTTGETLRAATKALLRAGAVEVACMVVCRTSVHQRKPEDR
ncbi:ComF family protein [Desulfovibrio cuneatus]|uniref:ComF family protein n=1 Tax=Desulfovibrio cuneatus TaxID=159728 RepID=UPI000407A8B5|nr:ComF family protein [Desulfovibrio cuneatus]